MTSYLESNLGKLMETTIRMHKMYASWRKEPAIERTRTPAIKHGPNSSPFCSFNFSCSAGKDLKTGLKSLPGRSFKNTWHSGECRPFFRQLLWMVVIISETAMEVFGPDEQPSSAILTHSGKRVLHKSTTASWIWGIDLDRNVFYNQMKDIKTYVRTINHLYIILGTREWCRKQFATFGSYWSILKSILSNQ